MQQFYHWFQNCSPALQALLATTFTWGLTAAGSATVFFVHIPRRSVLDFLLGFAGGVMVAASFWSLLQPALALGENQGPARIIPVLIGFASGALFLYLLDKILPHKHINAKKGEEEGLPTRWRSTTLLVLAITLHNIPEGLAVGVLFGAVAAGMPGAGLGDAISLAIGIGLQNFPEGLAVSMPLRRLGMGRLRSFHYGHLSAIVEPLAGVLGAMAVQVFRPLLPYALAFAAGAMIFVVVEEVIPETQRDRFTDLATLGFILGFMVMMSLDVLLG